jgi:hypothetical protein
VDVPGEVTVDKPNNPLVCGQTEILAEVPNDFPLDDSSFISDDNPVVIWANVSTGNWRAD